VGLILDSLQFGILVGSILSATLAFIWVAISLNRTNNTKPKKQEDSDLIEQAKEDVVRIFNDDFREELRNRGRLHFEKIISENAMFLQHDLRLTTSQLNEYMKTEIASTLKEEFTKYEVSIENAKELALQSIAKTQQAIEDQRTMLEQQLTERVSSEKAIIMERFEGQMGEILNHYILEAIGSEIDLTDQLEFIFHNLEDNKQAIIEDIRGGA
jgi:hypothetical protein